MSAGARREGENGSLSPGTPRRAHPSLLHPVTPSRGPAAGSGISLTALPPLSLYVHLPWCVRKCPYCDFNSHELRAAVPEDEYAEALIADLEQALPQVWGRSVHSVFFGGGTPSLFSAAAIERILQAVRARLRLQPEAEITLEANPGTVDAERFAGFREAGVNRLSLGVQSFDAASLRALGRIHGAADALRAVEAAQAQFDNLNVDIMYALPGQRPEQALADIDQAIGCGPQHVSAYHLTIEPNTRFHRFPPPLPDDDTAAAMQEAIEERLRGAGFQHYETSAFARPGRRALHNLNYWQFGDYLGIGAGAHSKISFAHRIVRSTKPRHPKQYMQQAAAGEALAEAHEVTVEDLPFEFMMNALRLTEGFALRMYEERTGLALTTVLARLDGLEREGLIVRDHATVRPTERGRRFLNDLLQRFLPPPR